MDKQDSQFAREGGEFWRTARINFAVTGAAHLRPPVAASKRESAFTIPRKG
jgi:hypothetical protein